MIVKGLPKKPLHPHRRRPHQRAAPPKSQTINPKIKNPSQPRPLLALVPHRAGFPIELDGQNAAQKRGTDGHQRGNGNVHLEL